MLSNYYHIFVILCTIGMYILLKKYNDIQTFKRNFVLTLYVPVVLYTAYYVMNYIQSHTNDMSDIYQSSNSL